MKKLFYSKQIDNFKVECFKDTDKDELSEEAYIIQSSFNGKSDNVTTNTPQAAIGLADLTIMIYEEDNPGCGHVVTKDASQF